MRDDESACRGKVGHTYSIEEDYEAVRLIGLNLLAIIKDALGDPDQVAGF